MKKVVPIIGVVYQSADGNWRGFCYPYDVTCNADSIEEAKSALDELVQLYEDNLAKHGNPSHLIENGLSDEEDQKIFDQIWPEISQQISAEIKKSTPQKYSESLSSNLAIKSPIATITNFSHLSFFQTA